MGPLSDVEKIKEIYRAEREAERIVRNAETAAKAMVEEAEAAAVATLAAKREEFSRSAGAALEKRIAGFREEADAFLDASRRRTEEWLLRSERSIDDVVDALIEAILPS